MYNCWFLSSNVHLDLSLATPTTLIIHLYIREMKLFKLMSKLYVSQRYSTKVDLPKTNTKHKINTFYYSHTFETTKCMVVMYSVGYGFIGGFGYA